MNVTSQLCALVILVVVLIFFITSKPLKLPTTIAFYIMLFNKLKKHRKIYIRIVKIMKMNNIWV
jgi:hypothetical protein